jgi:long-chain acyl-CoA synthetase
MKMRTGAECRGGYSDRKGLRMVEQPRAAVVVADTGAWSSHAELEETSARVASALRSHGLRQGDTVAVLAGHSVEVFQVRRAARRSGLLVVALDAALALEEMAFVINDSGARALFVSGEHRDVASSLRALTPYVELRCAFDGSGEDVVAYADLLQASPLDEPDHRDDAVLYYTAGTRARPRGVRRSGRVSDALEITGDTVLFSPTSWSDPVASQLFDAVLDQQGTVVTLAGFDAAEAVEAMRRHGPTLLHLLPWHLLRLMKHPEAPPTGATLVHSSAPCPPGVKHWAIQWLGDRVIELYGGAACDVLTVVTAEEWRQRPCTVGRPVRGEIHVCDLTGEKVPGGRAGLVYFENDGGVPFVPGLVLPHPTQPRWFSLGDVGRVDAEGYLYLVDRSREIEDLLVVHPKVADAAVLAAGDERQSRPVLRAVVQPSNGVPRGVALDRELRAYLRGRVPAERIPQVFDFVDTLPRTASGKVVKRKLAPRFVLSDTVA